jgi:hypothetical protein
MIKLYGNVIGPRENSNRISQGNMLVALGPADIESGSRNERRSKSVESWTVAFGSAGTKQANKQLAV